MGVQQPLGVALFGYGYAGKTFHAPLIAAVDGLKLAHIVSSNREKVVADWPHVQVSPDHLAVFQDPNIGLVVIATPNDTHFELARQALESGKNVVVDKPFTTTLQEAEQLIALSQSKKRLLSVFHNRRWDADFLTVQRLISQGQLGEVMYFQSHIDRYRPVVQKRWREQPGKGTGVWFDLGPHLVDQSLVLFGQPDEVYLDIATQREGAAATDYFHAILKYGNKRVALHASSLAPAETPRFVVHGKKGSFVKYGMDVQEEALKRNEHPGHSEWALHWGMDPRAGHLTICGDNGCHNMSVSCGPGDYTGYYRAIHHAIVNGAPNPVPPEQALAVMKILVAQ